MLFTDNMVLVVDSEKSLQVNLTYLDEALTKWEMRMNWEEMAVMNVCKLETGSWRQWR